MDHESDAGETSPQRAPTVPSPPKIMKFSDWADTGSPSTTQDDELEQYLNQDCGVVDDVALYWRTEGSKYPRLQRIAEKILCIPASSAASERNFSSAGFVLDKRRSQLSADNVDATLFIHSVRNV